MNYKQIRERIGLTQEEFAVLLGIPLPTIQNWEQGHRKNIDSAAVTLYRLIEKGNPAIAELVLLACEKKYDNIHDALAVVRLIEKFIKNKSERGLTEVVLFSHNPHFDPEKLGFRVTKMCV
jgi:transcriptional regulator with XRE-family HTH domain